MRTATRFVLLSGTALFVLNAGAQQRAGSDPRFRVVATILASDGVRNQTMSPAGNLLLYNTRTELRIRPISSTRSIRIADGNVESWGWSTRGDRIAWSRRGDGDAIHVWTVVIDTLTGTPRSAPQRVTAENGEQPAVSADGAWIAYVNVSEADRAATLRLVPSTGGPERTIARMRSIDDMYWSSDGRSIYVSGALSGSDVDAIYKVGINGMRPQLVHSLDNAYLAGMSRNRTFLVLVPNNASVQARDSAVVVDTTGRALRRVPLPVGTRVSFDRVLGDSVLVWEDRAEHRELVIRAIAGGREKTLTLTGESNEFPQWSPDGRRIAFHVLEKGKNLLAVVNADGSNLRVLRDVPLRDDAFAFKWSPDGRSIGFSNQSWHQHHILDVDRWQVTTVLADSTFRVGNWTWHDNSRAMSMVMLHPSVTDSGTIETITVAGQRHRLTFLDPLIKRGPGFAFVDSETVFLRGAAGAFTRNLKTGVERRLADVSPASANAVGTGVSQDRQLIATRIPDSKRYSSRLEIIDVATTGRREVEVPFWFLGPSWPRFSPDKAIIYVTGRQLSDSTGSNVYAVRTDGGGSNQVANLGPNVARSGYSISHDGRDIVYSRHHAGTTSLLLVDLRPANQGRR